MRVLVTGAAGFIGAATALRLLERGDRVFGYDNINDYYDPVLKHARLARLRPFDAFSFEKAALENRDFNAAAHILSGLAKDCPRDVPTLHLLTRAVHALVAPDEFDPVWVLPAK